MTDQNPRWGTDRPLDRDIVRSALAEAFPDFVVDDVQSLGSGWDFDTYGLGLQWVARFPRRADVIPALETEHQVMPIVGAELERLGIGVPVVHGVGQPTEAFPHPFLVQRRLWGLPLDSIGPARFAIRLAEHLAQALSTVHALVPPVGMDRARGDEEAWLAHAVRAASDLSLALRERVSGAIAWIEGSPGVPQPYPGPPRLLHNDLSPEHIRIARTGLGVIGILDWSDMAGGDPARDFAKLYCWGGPGVLTHMLEGYTLELDDGFAERVAFVARVDSVAWLRDVELQEAGEGEGGNLEKHIAWVHNAFSAM